MSNFNAKNELVFGRQLKVERLVIPFSIVGNATSTSVVSTTDEPALMFISTEGVDNITGALVANETATFTTAANDTSGIFNVLVKIQEPVKKLLRVGMSIPSSGATGNSAKAGSATGITTGTAGGTSVMVTCTASVTAHSGSTLAGCLDIEYTV